MAQPATTDIAPLQERLLGLVQTLQFAWFTGHFLTLLGTAFHLLSVVTFRTWVVPYRFAYVGALLSYGVVVSKTHKSIKLNAVYLQRLVMDENVQYMLLALCWFFVNPVTVTLLPFATFSLFHSLGYVRNKILPTVYPSECKEITSWQFKIRQGIQMWTEKNYTSAMQFVAQTEVVAVMGRLLLGIFRLRLMPIFFFAQFLRVRYHFSSYTRQSFTNLRRTLDTITADPRVPPSVRSAYLAAQEMVIRFGQSLIQQQPRR
ncbi:hypothetical protein LRAMOSA05996 [Lichtheimia ramosa]|uniref:Tetra-spanning protein 1 n=1 Tax=Lichtheimia ramosa TaxID=688394 RepID=A0A077X485_9FUNG|nr:hypothetical protein LRAMOSA05996 [Lichtheimia ramosa]